MLEIAGKMLLDNRSRLMLTVVGIGFTFFLTIAQVGLLVGWCRTTSALICNADVDLWVMAESTSAFDYGTAIPRQRVYQVRSVDGVAWAEAMFIAWNIWQRPDGRRVNVELVGLDESFVGGPWTMHEGELSAIERPDAVVIDELYAADLGVAGIGDEIEMLGRRAVIAAISSGVRTFTASPFVFTSIDSAIRYDRRYRQDEVTYVLVRVAPGHDVEQVRCAILDSVPHVDVMSTRAFARHTNGYWMLETGVGITVVITALLGILVGAVVLSQTLYAITQEHVENYTTLIALGFARRRLVGVVLVQSLIVGGAAVVLGSALFWLASHYASRTVIPLAMTQKVYAGLGLVALTSSVVAALWSIKSLFRIDPVAVFRG